MDNVFSPRNIYLTKTLRSLRDPEYLNIQSVTSAARGLLIKFMKKRCSMMATMMQKYLTDPGRNVYRQD